MCFESCYFITFDRNILFWCERVKMPADGTWMTPFMRQSLVVVGASINMAQIGMVMGYAASLLPQLRASTSFDVDDAAGSWVAATPAFGLLLGNVTIPLLMVKYGRRKANLISIIVVNVGWSCLVFANSLPAVLAGRLLQGLSAGMSSCLTPILIGEYTSPKNRGAFTIVMSLIMAAGTFIVHAVGSFTTWKITALVCSIISLVDFVMVLCSPESPTWLADRGRYKDCENAFRWLRGSEEEEELSRMIDTSKSNRLKAKGSISFRQFVPMITKKEFYKPIIIMMHLFTMGQWAGINILAPYIVDLVESLAGSSVDVAAVVMSVDIQRMVSCVFAVFLVRRLKRRTMLFGTLGFNCLIMLSIAGFAYAKERTRFSSAALGVTLLHLLMATVATGSLPLPLTIAGEIFPLKYKGLSSGISSFFCSINIFVSVKTFPYFENNIGLHGACCIYSAIMVYCLVVVWFLLPETKDRTLQEIEDQLKGVTDDDLKSAQPLTDKARDIKPLHHGSSGSLIDK